MSDPNRAALGGDIDPKCGGIDRKCSKPGGPATTLDFVEVSPLMRSCIFGFNTHVAELPSSAADVKASGGSLLSSCSSPSADETAVHKAFLSQLPADQLSTAGSRGGALEKRRLPTCLTESSTGLLDETPWWMGACQSVAEGARFLPAELRSRLAKLAHETNCHTESKDSRLARKPAACVKRGRQAARRPQGAVRAGLGSAASRVARDSGTNEPPDDAAGPLASVNAEGAQAVTSCWNEHDTTGSAYSVSKQQGDEQGGCSLLGALSLSLDNLAESFDDVIEPTCGFLAREGRHASGALAGSSPMRVPLDAGDVFAEMQTTMLALLEDLHAASCCCAPASSRDPCSCCLGSPFLMKGVDSKHGTLAAEQKAVSPCGSVEASKVSHGEPSTPVLSPCGTGSLTTGIATRLHASGPDSTVVAACSAPAEKKDAGKKGSDSDASASYTHEMLTPSSVQKETSVRGAEAFCDHVQMPSATEESGCGKSLSGPKSMGEQGRNVPPSFFGAADDADVGLEATVDRPHSSATGSSSQLLSEGSDFLMQCVQEVPEGSLHLLFRHHVAVLASADLFSELLPYSHIFRECVGTYRMPTTLPSSARHLLVQELFLLRQDPDRLLSRNSFQWTGTAGAVACLADHTGYLPKSGGNTDGLQPERLTRRDDTGRCFSTHSSIGLKMGRLSGYLNGDRNEAAAPDSAECADSTEGHSTRKWMPPVPLLDPTLLLCASGREMASQKSAVLRLLRMLRSLAPSWAARDDNFGFHFKSVVSAASLDSEELQSYRIVLQCLSPFDAREWSRDQILEVLSDLDCIRLAQRRRRSLRAGIARVQRFVEQREADSAGSPRQIFEGTAMSRPRWEKGACVGATALAVSARLPLPRPVVRGGREAFNGQHATSTCTTVDSPRSSGTTSPSVLPQSVNATQEQNHLAQQAAPQQMLSSVNSGRSFSKISTAVTTQHSGAEGVPHEEGDADLTAIGAGGGSCSLAGPIATSGSSRRVQTPVGSSVSVRRDATSTDTSCLTNSSAKAGNGSPGDCTARHQYAERAAELPKIKGVFIGKKHTCWVAQWIDANGQPRQSCFNIKQHGFEKARRLAVQARQALMGGSASKSASLASGEAQQASAPGSQSAPSPTEAASTAAKLPDFLLTRDATAAITEALGSRIVHTPTAIEPSVKLKLGSPFAVMSGRGVSVNRNVSTTAGGKGAHSSADASQADVEGSGNVDARNVPRLGEPQRSTVVGTSAELSVTPAELQLQAVKKEANKALASASCVPSSGSPPKQQFLMQRRLQQQLEEQLQQLQHLQQQLMQQPFSTAQPSIGALRSLLPDVIPSRPSASPHAGDADGSSSGGAFMGSILCSSNAKLSHIPPPSDQDHVEAPEHLENLSALRLSEAQRQLPVSGEICARSISHQLPAGSLDMSCADSAICGASDGVESSLSAPFSAAEALEEDAMPAYAKRKHRVLYVQKHGKRTLASLAREFPSVGGVAYNVKCACWEVTIKGRSAAKIFSTRKFGSLEAAYGAAVMWKRKVERGEEGVDDADGPDAQEDDGEEMEESEGLGNSSASAAWGSGLDSDESLRKRAAYFKPEVCSSPSGVSLPQQLSPTGLPSLIHGGPLPDGEGNHIQPHFSRTTSL
ncbi:hypothetical protein ACSSS7_000111 [Eimeria intestinalis]